MTRRKRAFTLVELLVVITILIVLAGLLIPSLAQVRAVARRVQCANNLHQIGNAFVAHKADERMGIVEPLTAFGWGAKLMPYLEDKTGGITICPAHVRRGSEVSLAGIVVYVWGAFDMYLQPGPWVTKTDVTATGYKLRFEDWRTGSSDKDYNDVVLRIDYLPDGNIRITVDYSDSANHFSLLGPDREVLLYDLETQIGRSITTMGVSYGMNNMVHDMQAGGRWVLAMDYVKEIADCAGPDAMDDWDNWIDSATGVPEFARHGGRCNVLFADTSVRSVPPAQIDPDVPALAEHYWNPGPRR